MKISDKKTVFKGFYEVSAVVLTDEKNNKQIKREQFNLYDSVAALVMNTNTNEVILVKQFRVGAEKEIIEIPAGKCDVKDETLAQTIEREIMEEIGFKTDELAQIACFYTTPGPVTEKMTLFYAKVSEKVGAGGGVEDENEQIEIISMKKEQFLSMIFEDAKTIIAQQWLQIHG
jgi:ADP-ribose pyrophosphatase